MTNFLKVNAILYAVFFVMGCSPESKTEALKIEESKTEKSDGVIPEHQLKALEKAKATEDLLKEEDEQRRQQLEGL